MDLVSILVSVGCVAFSVWIMQLYWRNKIGIVESLIYATVVRFFAIRFLGPTVDVLFLVSYAISIHLLFKTRFIHKKIVQISLLAVFSFALFLIFSTFFDTNLRHVKISNSLLNDLYFVLKYLFPVLVITNYLLLNGEDNDKAFSAIRRAAVASCCIAVFQLLLFLVIKNNSIREVFGLTGGDKYMYEVGSLGLVRLQAFCYEPKGLAAFLGIAFPIFLTGKKYLRGLFCFIIGVLTVSQTFFLIVLAYIFVRFFSVLTRRVSLVSLFSILLFFGMFNMVNFALDKLLGSSTESAFSKIVLNRALSRFDVALKEENNDLFGFPLQRDIELPAVNYFKDNNFMLLTGFGSGNYKEVPLKYFVVDWNIDLLEKNQFKGHFDMGWIFFISELGFIFAFFLYLLISSQFIINNSVSLYYSFIIVVFFFHRIDFLLFSFFALVYYTQRKEKHLFLVSGRE
ncbi:MAG: hypothetical protein EOO43_00245 [Flavobacterium sp.]|nr:MAG: hypothetical protein EOO43_00245 [Flavobacterium sp.]